MWDSSDNRDTKISKLAMLKHRNFGVCLLNPASLFFWKNFLRTLFRKYPVGQSCEVGRLNSIWKPASINHKKFAVFRCEGNLLWSMRPLTDSVSISRGWGYPLRFKLAAASYSKSPSNGKMGRVSLVKLTEVRSSFALPLERDRMLRLATSACAAVR